MKAKDRAHFIRSWRSHIEELSGLVLSAAGTDASKFEQELDAYNRYKAEIVAQLTRAADLLYPTNS